MAVKAADLADEPERALAAALFRGLSPRHGPFAQEAAQEAPISARTPGAVPARREETQDMRRRLTDGKSGPANPKCGAPPSPDILLYETPGSRVDAYARRIRATLRAALAPLRLFWATSWPASRISPAI